MSATQSPPLPPAPRRELSEPGRVRRRSRPPVRERAAVACGILVVAGAITVAAALAGAVPVTTTEPATVAIAATPADLVCPGPETMVVPEGSQAVSTGGRQALRAAVGLGASTAASATASFDRLGVRSADRSVADGSSKAAEPAVPRPDQLTAESDILGLKTRRPQRAGAFLLQADPGKATAQGATSLTAASQVGLATAGDLRGLSGTPCGPAVADAWVVGGSTRTGERSRLLLANPMSSPAVVDVTLLGPKGRVRAPNAEGIVVPPGEQIAVALDALAPGLTMVATHVVARSGRVAVTMFDTVLRGLVAGGTDDVAPTASPARRLVVPGVALAALHGAGASVVRIAVPGTEDAVVKVTLLGADGPVVLPGGVLAVAAGSVAEVRLDGADGVPAGHYSVLVEADSPVTAAVRLGRGAAGSEKAGTPAALGLNVPPSEFAWASATPDFGPPSTAADDELLVAVPAFDAVGVAEPDVRLDLGSAGTGEAELSLRFADASGALGEEQDVTVPAGGTVSVPVPPGASGVILPRRAGVHAALVIAAEDRLGPLLSVLPISPPLSAGHDSLESRPDPRLGLDGRSSSDGGQSSR